MMSAPETQPPETLLAPLLSQAVSADLTDYNGHMGDYAYGILFSRASVVLLDRLDLGADYRTRTACTVYSVEINIKFLKELKLGEVATISYSIADVDPKRFHAMFFMSDAHARLAAIYEVVMVHVRQHPEAGPKSHPFDAALVARLGGIREACRGGPAIAPRLGLMPRPMAGAR